MRPWVIEFYEDAKGRRPVEAWLESLSIIKAEAAVAAIQFVLQMHGLKLIESKWLKGLGGGLYEFRIRHGATQIKRMYDDAGYEGRNFKAALVLRIFVAFQEDRVILLLGAYDKGRHDSATYQQKQIAISRKRLREFKNRD